MSDRMRRYNQSAKGRARKAAYRERHRDQIRAADVVRARLNRAAIRARLGEIKVAAGCVDCGYNAHPNALDFDHVDGTKVAGLSVMAQNQVAWSKIEAEVAKCVVRCANCHRIKTIESREYVQRLAEEEAEDRLF